MSWIPLESNPEVMNKFIQKLGVPPKIEIVDVYSLDPELLAIVPQPVLAILLLFPCYEEYDGHKNKPEEVPKAEGQTVPKNLFFVKQYVHNACGTIALIHGIANSSKIELGDGYLKQFLEESKALSPDERGHLLEKSDGIINTHKEVAAEGQTTPPDDHEPVPYHFVAFVQKDGSLYELDGRKEFPINHGPSSEETFLQDAAEACRKYMNRDPCNVNFTIVALTSNK